MEMIEPTVGRIVWVYMNNRQQQPIAAIVAYVRSNEEIAVFAFDPNYKIYLEDGQNTATPLFINEIKLLQTDADYKGEYPYATWMPYQKGQAAKTEQLEKQNKITYEKPDNQTHTFKD